MGGANYEPKMKIEASEFARNMYLYVDYLIKRFKPARTIIALDDTPWRNRYFQDYYVKHSTVMRNNEKGLHQYIIMWDSKYHRITFNTGIEKWVMKKLLVAEVAELQETSFDGFTEILDPKDKFKIMYTDLYDHMLRYKKRDKSDWAYSTPYPEFKKISKGLAYNIGRSLNAITVEAKDAEADDIIAVYTKALAKQKSPVSSITVTVDTDLQQLGVDNMFFNWYNPNMLNGKPDPYGGFDNKSTAKLDFEFRTKILAGDISDTIPGTFLIGKKNLLSKAKAEGILLDDNPNKFIRDNVDKDALTRNITLVNLDFIPKSIVKRIVSAFKKPLVADEKYDKEFYHVSGLDLIVNEEVAGSHRLLDVSTGIIK